MTGSQAVQDGMIAIAIGVTLGVASIIVRTLLNGVPPMPSSQRVRTALTGLLLQIALPRGARIVELGSGWGGLSFSVSRRYPTSVVTGYENSPVPLWFSKAVRWLIRVNGVRFVRADFHAVSLRNSDLVLCYLSPEAMVRLQPKLAAELKASALVVSSTFALPEWKPSRVLAADDIYRTPIYLYHAAACRNDTLGRHVNIVEPESEG